MMTIRIKDAFIFMFFTAILFLAGTANAQFITSPASGDVIKAGQNKILLNNPPSGTDWAVLWSGSGKDSGWINVNSYPGIGTPPTSVSWNPFINGMVDSNCYVAFIQETNATPLTFDTTEKDGPFVLWTNLGIRLNVLSPDSAHRIWHQDSTYWIKFSSSNPTPYSPDTLNVYVEYLQQSLPPTVKRIDTLLKRFDAADLRNGGADSISFKVPKTPTNAFKVFVTTTDHFGNGSSDSITIKGATISITSPKGGDTLYVGGVDTIRWSVSDSVSNDTVSISYSPDGHTFTTIANKVPSWKGYYVWNLQGVQTTTNGEILISADGGFVNQPSSAFSVYQVNGVSEPANVPSVYLDQNYPNPFSATGDNSVTNIPFSLRSPQNISLQVFDVLGREVFHSPAQFFNAGTHTMQFNAAQFLPGAYWYDVVAGTRSLTGAQRMMLYVK